MTRIRLLFLTLLLCWSGRCSSAERDGPAAKVQGNAVHDFGSRYLGEVGVHTFQIKNVGTEPLTILDTRSSCGCAVLEVEDRRIEPGAVAGVTARFTPDKVAANLRKTLWVTTNDPVAPELTLQFQAQVEDLYRRDPELVDMGAIVAGTIPLETVRVELLTKDPFQVLSVAEDWQTAEVEWEQIRPEVVEIRFRPRADLAAGPKRWALEFETDQERQPTLEIPISAVVKAPFYAEPRRVDFGQFAAANDTKRSFQVNSVNPGDRPVPDTVVVTSRLNRDHPTDPPWVDARVGSNQEGSLTVDVTVLAGAPASNLIGRVDVRLQDERQPVITVVLSGAVVENSEKTSSR